jgi:hypothetical protein
MKAKKQGRCFSRMANGNIINKIFRWKTIIKKLLKKSNTSAKKYLQLKWNRCQSKCHTPYLVLEYPTSTKNNKEFRLTTEHQYLVTYLPLWEWIHMFCKIMPGIYNYQESSNNYSIKHNFEKPHGTSWCQHKCEAIKVFLKCEQI